MDISNLSADELKRLLAQIPKEIERRQKEERAKALKEIESFAAERGFALDELIGGERPKKARAPVAAKYRDPSNPQQTWTGRGRQPRWVVEFLQKGGSLTQLQV
ncbi:MAG TPA: H-NS histone family protein [Rhodocyclaceae bacterium]|nr:H-NS histone family protein [Rhodocyclaceae bacterium]